LICRYADACFDVIEAGFTDNNDGILGANPVTTNNNGLNQQS
jgi:hypothetical protein